MWIAKEIKERVCFVIDGRVEAKTQKKMTWCNDSDEDIIPRTLVTDPKPTQIRTITCPSCGHNLQFQDQVF